MSGNNSIQKVGKISIRLQIRTDDTLQKHLAGKSQEAIRAWVYMAMRLTASIVDAKSRDDNISEVDHSPKSKGRAILAEQSLQSSLGNVKATKSGKSKESASDFSSAEIAKLSAGW